MCPFVSNFVPGQFKTQKICDTVVSKEPFMLKCCPDKCKTQWICDKAVDFYLITLKFIADWFVTNKMLEKLDNSWFSNSDTFFHDVDSNIITFLTDDMGFNIVDVNNINLDDDSFDENHLETINHVRIMTWRKRLKRRKSC